MLLVLLVRPWAGRGLVVTVTYIRRGVGESEALKKVFVPAIHLQSRAPLINSFFSRSEPFLMWVGGGLLNRHQVGGVSRSPDGLFAQQEREPIRGRPTVRGKRTYGGRPGQHVEEQGTWAAQKHSEVSYRRPVDRGVWTANTVKRPRQRPAHPQYAKYWAPLTRKRHTPPHSAQPQHTNYWAPRTRKRHQQEHRPQRPTESSDPTQHAKGRPGDCPGPRKGATTRRNVTQGGQAEEPRLPSPPPPPPLQIMNCKFRSLDLSHDDLGPYLAEGVAKGLGHNRAMPVRLNLTRTNLMNGGAAFIAQALEANTALLELNLTDNKIENDGAAALMNALQTNRTLQFLYLDNNIITDKGALLIENCLMRRSLAWGRGHRLWRRPLRRGWRAGGEGAFAGRQ